jgi:hypothetical protein
MPRWLKDGFVRGIKNNQGQGRQGQLRHDRLGARLNAPVAARRFVEEARELMTLSVEDFWEGLESAAGFDDARQLLRQWHGGQECAHQERARRLRQGAQDRASPIKTEEIAKDGDEKPKPKTEEEEGRRVQEPASGYKEKEKRILEETQRKAFSAGATRTGAISKTPTRRPSAEMSALQFVRVALRVARPRGVGPSRATS